MFRLSQIHPTLIEQHLYSTDTPCGAAGLAALVTDLAAIIVSFPSGTPRILWLDRVWVKQVKHGHVWALGMAKAIQ